MYQGTITRKMKSARINIYRDMLTQGDFESKIAKLENAEPSVYPTICADVCEMFNALGIKCETGREAEYYVELFELKRNNIPEFVDIEKKILKAMFENFESYPTPEEYMLRIVNRLSAKEDNWQEDSLRLRILKQFIKYTDCLAYDSDDGRVRVYGGEAYLKKYAKVKKGKTVKTIEDILENIDEEIFDVLETATKAQKKFDGTYGILKLSDDLANGIFKAGGATKRDLYMFAIAFDMTYSIADCDQPTPFMFDYNSDIEKNLFEDYYTSNLMRFITEAYKGDLSAFELDPSGRGINYKNFAEMVYIYFISKDLDPIEKLRRATEMIARLEQAEHDENSDNGNSSTQYYSDLFTEKILKMDESEFESFILENYDCDVHDARLDYTDKKGVKHEGKKAVLQIQASQQTAFNLYLKLIEKMESEEPVLLRENCNYGLWFTDVSAFGKYKKNESILSSENDNSVEGILKQEGVTLDLSTIERFKELLLGINMFLGHSFVESEIEVPEEENATDDIEQILAKDKNRDMLLKKEHKAVSNRLIKKMSIDDAEDMTRTALIVAYYYRYNQLNERRGIEKSFVDVMDDYMDPVIGLNSMLEASGYQPINDRNIFDLAVIFSSYAYLAM